MVIRKAELTQRLTLLVSRQHNFGTTKKELCERFCACYNCGVMQAYQSLASAYATTVNQFVDHQLMRQVEIIEGRVPSNEEIARYGMRGVHRDGTIEWKWRGTTLLVQKPSDSVSQLPTKYLVAIPE